MHPVIGCRTKTVKGEKAPAIERQFYTQNHRESLLVAVIEEKLRSSPTLSNDSVNSGRPPSTDDVAVPPASKGSNAPCDSAKKSRRG